MLVRGRVSVYEQRGQMQLVAETMEPVGAGSLQLAFEQLTAGFQVGGLRPHRGPVSYTHLTSGTLSLTTPSISARTSFSISAFSLAGTSKSSSS